MAKSLKRYALCLLIMIIAMSLLVKFYALGCVVSIEELVRFSIGNVLYFISLGILLDNRIDLNVLLKKLSVFFILNVLSFFIASFFSRFYIFL